MARSKSSLDLPTLTEFVSISRTLISEATSLYFRPLSYTVRVIKKAFTFLREPLFVLNSYVEEKEEVIVEDSVGKTILFVGDDVNDASILADAFEGSGLRLIMERKTRRALNLLRKDSNIDLVLLDIMKPQMEAIQVLREITKEVRLKNIPIIAVIPKNAGDKMLIHFTTEMSDHISKPFHTDEIILMVKSWLDKK